jgi:hypothetical protein
MPAMTTMPLATVTTLPVALLAPDNALNTALGEFPQAAVLPDLDGPSPELLGAIALDGQAAPTDPDPPRRPGVRSPMTISPGGAYAYAGDGENSRVVWRGGVCKRARLARPAGCVARG